MNFRNRYAPSVADTMSVFSGPSVRGSVYGENNPPIIPRLQI